MAFLPRAKTLNSIAPELTQKQYDDALQIALGKKEPPKNTGVAKASSGYVAPAVGSPIDNLAVYQQELTDTQKRQKAQSTQDFFNEHPVVAGAIEGFSPISLKNTVSSQTGYDVQAPDSAAYKAANVGGTVGSYILPYAAIGKGVTALPKVGRAATAAGKALEGTKLASSLGKAYLGRAGKKLGLEGAELAGKLGYGTLEEATSAFGKKAAGELGERAVRSLAADAMIGTPLNALQAAKEEGSAKDKLKTFLLNEVMDLGAGVGIEALGLTLKSGKKILSEADIDALSPSEVEEVYQKLNATRRKLKRETETGLEYNPTETVDAPFERTIVDANDPIYAEGEEVVSGWGAPEVKIFDDVLDKAIETKQQPYQYVEGRLAELEATRKKIEDAMYDYMVQNNQSRGVATIPVGDGRWVTSGGGDYVPAMPNRMTDIDGPRIRASMNDPWYQEIFARTGRKPTKNTIREAAREWSERIMRDGEPTDVPADIVGKYGVSPQEADEWNALNFAKQAYEEYGNDIGKVYQASDGSVKIQKGSLAFPEMEKLVTIHGKAPRLQKAEKTAEQAQQDLGADINKTIHADGTQKTAKDYVEEYGSVKSARVPAKTPYGETQQHAGTIVKSKLFSKETDKEILGYVSEGLYGKFTQRNAKALADANKEIQDYAIDNARGTKLSTGREIADDVKWSDLTEAEQDEILRADGALDKARDEFYKMAGGDASASKSYLYGAKLARIYDALGMSREAANVLAECSNLLSEAGRALQAGRIMMANTPTGRVLTIKKLARKIGKNAGVEIELDDDLLKAIENATDEKSLREAMEKARIAIWNQVPPTWSEKFNAWRYTAMLGNPKTIIRNEVGNFVSNQMRQVKDLIGTPIESALAKKGKIKPGDRTKAVLTNADKKNIEYGRKLAEDRMFDLRGEGAKFSDYTFREQGAKMFNNRLAEGARKLTNRALEEGLGDPDKWYGKIIKGDAGWLKKVFSDQFAKIMKANGYTIEKIEADPKLLDRIYQQCKTAAQQATFRDYNAVADFIGKGSQRLANIAKDNKGTLTGKLAGGARVAIESALPFKRTPMNIVKQSVRYSPLGLVINGVPKMVKSLGKNASPEEITKAVDELCAGLTGTAAFGLGMFLQRHGLLNAELAEDKKEKNYQKAMGEQANALNLKIGDNEYSYTLDWASPSIVSMLMGATLMKDLGDGVELNDVFDMLSSSLEPLFETTMLQGLQNVMDSNSYGDTSKGFTKLAQAGINLGGSYVGQAVPSVMGAAARTVDKSNYRTNTANEANPVLQTLHYNLNRNVLSKIPGARSLLAENVNPRTGETDTKKNALDVAGAALENFVSPGYVSKKDINKTDEEILRLYTDLQDRGAESPGAVLPYSSTGYNLKLKGGNDARMTVKERQRFNEVKGRYVFKELGSLISTGSYKKASPEEKAKMIKSIYEKAYNEAKKDYYTSHGMSVAKYNNFSK